MGEKKRIYNAAGSYPSWSFDEYTPSGWIEANSESRLAHIRLMRSRESYNRKERSFIILRKKGW